MKILSPQNDVGSINTSVAIPETCSPIPDSLQPPVGNKFFLQTFARGVQIYEVQRNPANPSELIWVNIAPLATLYTNPNFTNLIINHFAGPSWQFVKGPFKDEKVVAKKVKGSTQDPTAIQWLLLQADDNLSTPGNPVSFIQRICTHGGLAPRQHPHNLGCWIVYLIRLRIFFIQKTNFFTVKKKGLRLEGPFAFKHY
jgi:hypothetical protein